MLHDIVHVHVCTGKIIEALGRVQTTDKKCRNGKVPMVIRSRDVIGPFSA